MAQQLTACALTEDLSWVPSTHPHGGLIHSRPQVQDSQCLLTSKGSQTQMEGKYSYN